MSNVKGATFYKRESQATYEEKVKALALLMQRPDGREVAFALGLLPAGWYYRERVIA